MSLGDDRIEWLQEVVNSILGTRKYAFKYMMDSQDGAKKLMGTFLDNPDNSVTTLCFYATTMEPSYARLVKGGKLSGEEEELAAAPPLPEPDPDPAAKAPSSEGAAPAAEEEVVPPAAAAPVSDGEAAPPAAAAPATEGVLAEDEAAPAEAAPCTLHPRAPNDPSELLQVHMCTPAELTPQACVSRLVYFTTKSETPGEIGKQATMSHHTAREGMDFAVAAAAGAMEDSVEYGVIAGGSIVMLEQVVHEVYLPLVQGFSAAQDKAAKSDIETTAETMEFVSNMQKFDSQLAHAIQQMNGDVRLTMPSLTIDEEDVDNAATDTNGIVLTLEQALEDWTPNIAMALENQLAKVPQGKGPLAEIEHWRNRAAALSTLYEQLNTGNARRMIRVLEKAESSLLSGFNYQFSELEKRYIEAKDNVKFLTTLERHFKHIRDGPLVQILDTLPSMMNALRMVWVISRHYKDDQRMEPLFGRIGWEIADRVSNMIVMRSIFKEPAIKLITDAKRVLECWKQSYMTMRQRIEESGRDNRWEFDRNKLFARTDYMAQRCGDLLYVAEMLRDMRAMLGPELKAVTGDAKGIDEVMKRVEALVVPLEQAPFDLFDRRYQTSWEGTMGKFRENVAAINETLQKFMDDSFTKLRNAEGAFDLLQKFRSMPQSQEAQAKLMERKTFDILTQYEGELDHVNMLFETHQQAPPLSKNQPPLAGAINWSHSLFLRIRQTIAKFQSMNDEMFNSEKGKQISAKFIAISKAIRRYEKGKFDEWKETVNKRAMECLKQAIFRWEGEGKIVVNFDEALVVLIRESKYLDRMGFAVPETALNVTLQEDKYHAYVESLNAMLGAYSSVISSLSPVETELLAGRIAELRAELGRGFDLLNWNSLSIPEFTDSCNKAINNFQTIVKQIQKNAATVKSVVDAISGVELLKKPSHLKDEVPEMSELADDIEKHRVAQVEELKRQYTQIGPLLVKVEEMVVNTNTGKSDKMAAYYAYWEEQIFAALNRMVITTLTKFLGLIAPREPKEGVISGGKLISLFRVNAVLSAPEVHVSPPLPEINKVLAKIVKSVVESTKSFVRWMNGTCTETMPQVVNDDEDPFVFSFYQDIVQNPDVVSLVSTVTRTIAKTFGRVNKQLDVYRKYDQLWKMDKQQSLTKFEQKQPTCVMFDSRLQSYSRVVFDADAMEKSIEVDFIAIAVSTLLHDIQEHARAWITAIATLMKDMGRKDLIELHDQIVEWSAHLEKEPDTLEDLKSVLNLVAEIRRRSMEIELKYGGIEEWYRTLRMYNHPIPPDEAEMVDNIAIDWAKLCEKAKRTDRSLGRVKKQFTIVTQGQVSEFQKAVAEMHEEFRLRGPGTGGVELDKGLELRDSYTMQLEEMNRTREELGEALKLFGLPIVAYPQLADVDHQLKELSPVYDLYEEFMDKQADWAGTLWAELEMSTIEKGMDEIDTRLKKFPKPLKQLRPYKKFEEACSAFTNSLPLIQNLKNDALRPRHWEKLMEVTGVTFDMNPKTFTLQKLFDMQLDRFEEQILEITGGASKELTIENGINQIVDTWRVQKFEVIKYMKGPHERGLILRANEEITQTLEDQMMNLSSMMSSRFVVPFLDLTQKWEKLMSLVSECIEVWMKVQAKWQYLEAIFIGSEDIRLQLPEEAKRFDRIQSAFKKIMGDTQKNPNVMDACSADGRLTQLQELFDQLESCQKSLSDYLETKRTSFPRFYFLSDDELLQILGTSDPTAVQEHMLKLFDNTAALTFDRGGTKVLGMVSSEKESFAFDVICQTEGAVETWLGVVELEMAHTLHLIHKRAVFEYPSEERVDWVKRNVGMVVNTGAQIWWTFETLDVFEQVRTGNKMGMKHWAHKNQKVLSDCIVAVRSPMPKVQTKRVNTLIIIDVHARDIIDKFVRDSVLDEREFAWESQLRFYWEKEIDNVKIRQCSGAFDYGYEYQGLNGRLVITPLTDRCYMTCTQSLHYRLGCAPAGPAGTGKTETVKDLSKAMSVQCKVFCCGEGLDFKAMGTIFSGLVQTGAWGCFDEFNRIPVEVLSVVSAQIKTIQAALGDGLKRFTFEGREINLVSTVGIYITMNPGYAGRAELPDNLKALFRPVVMVVPNLEMICENMLMSEGFGTAKILAKKMTSLYKLAEAQLSKQYHYDFKLRALKSVLVMAGGLKRASPEYDESTILMRALRDMNMPKFVYADVPLFRGLIGDLFPGLDCPRVRYPSFNDAVEQAITENGYQMLEIQIDKVVQLYETLMTRHTTMIVGPTGGGKTVALGTLCRAQTIANLPTKQFIINPKAIPVSELYGMLDPATRDWTDGLLSNIFRDMNRPVPEGKDERRYIVYDGDVDAVWVENMNSVMDDNKLLTLPNGERIRLNFPTCSMLFEVFDLQYASPATISRCGMVYVDPKDIGWQPYLWKWLNTRENPQEQEVLRALTTKYLEMCIDFVCEGIEDKATMTVVEPPKCVTPMTNLSMIQQLCTLLNSMLTEERAFTDPGVIEACFLYAMTWSLGGGLVAAGRLQFDKFLKKLSGLTVGSSDEAQAGSLPGSLPTLHDYLFDFDQKRWRPWSSDVPTYEPPADGKFSSIVVPTLDTVRSTFLLDSCVSVRGAVLFVGDSGTAKTTVVAKYLLGRDPDKWTSLGINFSSRTSSMDVQIAIEDSLEKRTKDTFGPPAGKRLLVFVDDLNMPRVDTYGTQQPIALLKLVIDKGFLYDRGKDLTIKYIKDMQFVSAMVPGRNDVDPRFVRLFNVFCITFPPEESIKRIYCTILQGFFDAGAFDASLQGEAFASKCTEAALEIFNAIVAALPPTPAKFHYIFNLRDLSRITEGVMLTTPDKFSGTAPVVRLLRHETMRVLCDRLVGDADKEFVTGKIEEVFKKVFPDDSSTVMADPILYGDFLLFNEISEAANSGGGGGDLVRLYEDLTDYATIKPVLNGVLEEYNTSNKAMNLVLFDDCLDHLVRVHRLMRLPRGNALLVGVGGSGKQSITRLAAYTAGADVFTITLTRGYNETLFREDLKALYGLLPTKPVAFFFSDAHVAEEGFLELVNNMLTSGMVPALYEESEKDGIVGNIRDEAVKRGAVDSKESIWNYFVGKCRDNLHVVLAMSPVGETLRVRCRSFPGMVNNTVIDWFVPWPEQALLSVAGVFLAEEDLPEAMRKNIVNHMVMVHLDVTEQSSRFEVELKRYNYVTPKNYLDFISNYRGCLKDERRKIDSLIQRLDGGLSKLVQAATEVDAMSETLKIAQKEVDVKTAEVKIMLEEIAASTKIAEEKQQAAGEKEAQLEIDSVKIAEEKAEAEAALEEALPALEEAAQALNDLKKDDITELKSFAKPHQLVQDVALCVVLLKGGKDVSWKGAKAMMTDGGFLRSLVEFEKDSLTDKQVKQVKAYMSNTAFTPDAVASISSAGAGLLKWVFAIVNYYAVAKTVNPKRQAVAAGEKALRSAAKELGKIKEEVEKLSIMLAELKDKFEKGSAEEKELSDKAQLMAQRLAAASKLITGLGSERTRWTSDMETLNTTREFLVGDCLLAAAFLSYTGAFNFDYRDSMMGGTWEPDVRDKNIALSTPFDLRKLLTTDVETARWAGEGLPQDVLSIQNGILTTRASRYPLCIDPQQQGLTWIKKKEAKSNLKICTFNDSDFLKHLEICVNLGFSFLFESVDEYIDPIIDPVLEKNLVKKGNSRTVKIGDKDVEWDDGFKLYLTSKIANPHYGPEIFGKVMIINYSVTLLGLEDQLLNEVVKFERADLAEQKAALVEEVAELSGMLKELEDTLLYELANSTGNILDNTDLIETLEKTKTKAVEISDKLEEAKATAVEIDQTCAAYRPVAKRGSILFFVMSSLSTLNNMYELSLALYMVVFLVALERAEPDSMVENRLENIINTLTLGCYSYTCRGIFETHKLMFSLQMTLRIMDGEGNLDMKQVDIFLKGNLSLEKCKDPPPGPWMSDAGWHDMQRVVAEVESCANLIPDIKSNIAAWKDWYDLDAPETHAMPSGYDEKLSPLEKMLVLRCFRVDRVVPSIIKFVIATMGNEYVTPPVLDFMQIYKDSRPLVPIIFVLSPGADPATDIFKLAGKLGMSGAKMKYMALGQGQGPVAASMLEMGASRGNWVLLQNCHLLPGWLKTLEKILEQLQNPHEDFRLWMTTDPTPAFPIGILQRSIKVVTEPPNGLKLNMLASYSKVTDDTLNSCPHEAFKPCVFVLSFFHAVVQERRKYGKVGWNVKYDYNDSDFSVSIRLCESYLTKAHHNGDVTIPWDTLRYLVGEVMYGGRVTDDCDRRVVETYMQEYLGDFLFDTFQPFHFFEDGLEERARKESCGLAPVDYKIPALGGRDVYIKGIESMPGIEAQTPEVFGLHANAEIDYLTNSSKKVWTDLIDLQPRQAGGGGGITREEYIGNIASDVEAKVPPLFDLNKLRKELELDGFSPIFVVLVQELERFEKLNIKMTKTLKSLKKALKGEIAMSNELDELGTNLFNGQLPTMWRKLTPQTDKMLGSWVTYHLMRQTQYAAWVAEGEPKVMWLSGLSIPETYTAALVQTTCRRYGWPLDKTTMKTKVTKFTHPSQVTERMTDGCYVTGLYLEGAAWDVENQCLIRQPPKVLVQDLPIMQIIPVELNKLKLHGTIRVPLYITQQRRNAMGVGMMMEADLDTREHSSHWVLQGVALVLNTDT